MSAARIFSAILLCIIIFISYYINSLGGTDGHRLRCRQFYISSLPHPENCIKSSNTFSQMMNKLREALLLLYSIAGQGQETRHMVYPLRNGRLCCSVCLIRNILSEKLQMTMASHMKRYGMLFVLLVAAKRHILEQICQVASTTANFELQTEPLCLLTHGRFPDDRC